MDENADSAQSHAAHLVERFAKQLNITFKAVRLYPVTSTIPRQSSEKAVSVLHELLDSDPRVLLEVTREGLRHEGSVIFPQSEGFGAFAREFYARSLAGVRFHEGATADDIAKFVSLLDVPTQDIAAAGGFGAALWEIGVSNISVAEVATRIVDGDARDYAEHEMSVDVEGEVAWPPDAERIDQLIEEAEAGGQRSRRVLMRVLRDAKLVAGYLRERAARGTEHEESDLSGHVARLAHAVSDELPEDQALELRAIAEAVLDLEPGIRSRAFHSKLLEDARRDESISKVVREMGFDRVLDSILSQVEETAAARTGVARAVRNLALINVGVSKGAVLAAATDKMIALGMSEQFVEGVVEEVNPARLTVAEFVRASDARPVESVLRLLEMTPAGGGVLIDDEDVRPLQAEAARGTTDGDVLGALVTLATIEKRPEQSASIMSLLEDSVGLLIDSHEFEVAADVAEALSAAGDAPDVPEDRRTRFRDVVAVLATPDSMRKVTAALRLYVSDSPEYRSCQRLLSILGETTLDSLLEVLGEEPDMSARKAVVDLISGVAVRHISQLGARVTDRRWYLVRNVVSILGATRSPEGLPYLQRTLRHTDARVRRETVRALAAVRVGMADSLLAAALADEDAQNVQLAVRYLATLDWRGAVPALEDVARGIGRGNRETGPRIDAIEALGRLGAPSSSAMLRELARRRWFVFGGRDRAVRAAATAALRVIETGGEGGTAE
jgi:HEAT repeat protein